MFVRVEKGVRLNLLYFQQDCNACDPLVDCQLSFSCFGIPGYCNNKQYSHST